MYGGAVHCLEISAFHSTHASLRGLSEGGSLYLELWLMPRAAPTGARQLSTQVVEVSPDPSALAADARAGIMKV